MEDLIDVVRLDGRLITAKAIEGFEYPKPMVEGATVQYGNEEFTALNLGGVWREWPEGTASAASGGLLMRRTAWTEPDVTAQAESSADI